MLSKKYILDRDCVTLEQFFAQIVTSKINGANQQIRQYLGKMSTQQVGQFIAYLIDADCANEIKNDLLRFAADALQEKR